MITRAAPPQVLTMDEYRSAWEPQGWQLIIIGPTSTWRQDWGEWEAIRDIVQNALDECEYYTWGYDDEGLYIRDSGKGVAVADFLLGPPKLKPDYARGKFGEGMKIAALALIRMGYPVRVRDEISGSSSWSRRSTAMPRPWRHSGDPASANVAPSFMLLVIAALPSKTGLR